MAGAAYRSLSQASSCGGETTKAKLPINHLKRIVSNVAHVQVANKFAIVHKFSQAVNMHIFNENTLHGIALVTTNFEDSFGFATIDVADGNVTNASDGSLESGNDVTPLIQDIGIDFENAFHAGSRNIVQSNIFDETATTMVGF